MLKSNDKESEEVYYSDLIAHGVSKLSVYEGAGNGKSVLGSSLNLGLTSSVLDNRYVNVSSPISPLVSTPLSNPSVLSNSSVVVPGCITLDSLVSNVAEGQSIFTGSTPLVGYPNIVIGDNSGYAPLSPNFGLKGINPVESSNVFRMSLATTVSQKVEFEPFTYEISNQVLVEVQTTRSIIEDLREFIIEDSRVKDDMLNELLEYHSSTTQNKGLLEIKKIKFIPQSSTLNINGIPIRIGVNNNQEEICRVLFKNVSSVKKSWSLDEFAEELGYGYDEYDIKKFEDKIYQAVRRLNDKVAKETGIKTFVICSSKNLVINPKIIKIK